MNGQELSAAYPMDVWEIGEEEILVHTFVVREQRVQIFVNGNPLVCLTCTGKELEELAVGYLLTQGYIKNMENILYIKQWSCDSEICVEVRGDIHTEYSETLPVYAGRKGNWKKEWIFSLAELFAEGTVLYHQTRGMHSCMLAKGGVCLYRSEDIGRHNALDKVIGCAVRDGVDLSELILYSSGRIPSDMMRKVIRSGVPVIASNAVPTDEAIALAKANGVTLLGKVRPDKMLVFAG